MAVKTITIDLEAYDALVKNKKGSESFSQVIKRTFKEERYTAKHLLENLKLLSISNETLEHIEEIRHRHESEYSKQGYAHSSHGSADRDPCEMSWCSNPYQRY